MQEQSNSYSHYPEEIRHASGHSSNGILPALDPEVGRICWLSYVFALPLRLSPQPVFVKEELGKRNQGWELGNCGAGVNPSRNTFRSRLPVATSPYQGIVFPSSSGSCLGTFPPLL